MFYTIYRTTNTVNGKYYIGKHQTKNLDDGYMGSGKLLKAAISKYGKENFHKEILHVVQTEKEMDLLEKILVVPDQEINYNLCPGGRGGFGYLNDGSEKHIERTKKGYEKVKSSMLNKDKNSINGKNNFKLKIGIFDTKYDALRGQWRASQKNKFHSEETKQKMRKSKNKGSLNSQFGTCWITDGQENKKIKKEQLDIWIEKGYNKGRI